jgi:hypothetical protein
VLYRDIREYPHASPLYFPTKKEAMPATVHPASHPAREWLITPATSAQNLFQTSCPNEFRQSKRVIQSSFTDFTNVNISPSSNGLVRAAYAAYSSHHHLSIRPEDVWFSILTQLSFHINAHAEELRSLFVAHEGQKELVVEDVGTLETVNVGRLAVELTREMDKHLSDVDLHGWIMPNFTTTTETDTMTAAIIMMGSMQKYFSYTMQLTCGLPSVTLLGEQADWVDIRRRLDKLPHFGKEPKQFGLLLSSVLDYFILTFESPDNPEVVDFWSKIAHEYNGGSGPTYLSGWITAFCFWDEEGTSLFREPQTKFGGYDDSESGCNLNGTRFHRVDTDDIPQGYVSVPVLVDDNGQKFKTRMVAGSVGIAASRSGEKLDTTNQYNGWIESNIVGEQPFQDTTFVVGDVTGLDSLQPVSGWWMYELEG